MITLDESQVTYSSSQRRFKSRTMDFCWFCIVISLRTEMKEEASLKSLVTYTRPGGSLEEEAA